MTKKLLCAILCLLALPAAANASPEADSCNAFGFRLKTQLSGPAENLDFSPFSIYTALALTAGAAGRTAEQMAATVGLAPKLDLCSFQKLLSSAADTTWATFQRSTNGVWLATEPNPDFISRAAACFGAEVGGLSRERINARRTPGHFFLSEESRAPRPRSRDSIFLRLGCSSDPSPWRTP